MVSLSLWIQNWRRVAEAVPVGRYEPITAERGDRQYEILQVSGFDLEIDGERRVIRTGAREFDDKVALFTHLTRDIGSVRVITVRGRSRWVLEPGADSLDWVADTERVSIRELAQAVREGTLGRRVARLVQQRERRSREVLQAQVRVLREKAEDAEAEAKHLRVELHDRERALARYGAESTLPRSKAG
jgi:hypothetical protein